MMNKTEQLLLHITNNDGDVSGFKFDQSGNRSWRIQMDALVRANKVVMRPVRIDGTLVARYEVVK